MNDVMVQTKSRVIKSALPSKSQGGTMSKFTYYIEFMQHFLDAPIDKLINHDLNEVRFYRNLNLNVLILNSVSLANSLQNNKVGFDSVKVTELTELFLKDSNKEIRRICLSHHSPEYEINYVNDIYAPYNLFDINKCEKLSVGILYSCFCRCIKEIKISESIEIPTEFCENLKKAFNAFEDMITEYQNNEVILEIQEIVKNTIKEQQVTKKEIELWIKNFYESDLYSDIKGLYDYICKNLKNEFSLQLLNKLNNMHQMEYFDNNNYKEIYKNILNNNKSIPIHAVFSGHEHKKNENNIKSFGVPLYVESKFETGGSIITIKNNGEIRERKAL